MLKEVEADAVEIMGDSLLVISQLAGEYECKNDTLMVYNEKCQELMKGFRLVTLKLGMKLVRIVSVRPDHFSDSDSFGRNYLEILGFGNEFGFFFSQKRKRI